MSAEDTKPGALPVESAANEIDNAKIREASLDVTPAATDGAEEINSTNAETSSAPVEKTASAQSDEKMSDSEREDKIVQDAVKQSRCPLSEQVALSRN